MNEIRLENERKSKSVMEGRRRRRKTSNSSEKAEEGMEKRNEEMIKASTSNTTFKELLSTWIPFL